MKKGKGMLDCRIVKRREKKRKGEKNGQKPVPFQRLEKRERGSQKIFAKKHNRERR